MSAALPSLADRRAALEARHPTWIPQTLDGLLDLAAATWPDRPLVITDERELSYAETAAWAHRIGDGLTALGIGPGDRVGVLMANLEAFTPVKFGVARTGATAIPFNFLYRTEELAFVLRQSGCKTLITMTSWAGLDQLAMLDEIAPGWEHGATERLPALEHVVLVPTDDRPRREGAHSLDQLDQLGADHPLPSSRATDPGAPGDILYTSGTTGSPKGVVVTHDAVIRTSYASALHRAFEDGRRVLFSLPCYHMFGYVEGLLAVLHVGGAIVPRATFSAADHLDGIERHGATDILCVPTMTVALLEHPDRHTRDLSSVHALLSGAAPGPTWLWERAASDLGITEITTGYGMTECGGAMTLTLPEDPPERHAATVGRPKRAGVAGMPDGGICSYATADPLTGEHLPAGQEGELISTGPTHMLGFHGNPEQTAQTLRGGWLHSGDLGRVDEHGYLQVTGRSKELYKSGGELVMPKEVEQVIGELAGVSQVYAVGVPDERWGEAGCAWVVPEPETELDPAAVLDHCRARLARFKVPKHVLLTTADQLPTTPTGKVQKFRLVHLAAEALTAA